MQPNRDFRIWLSLLALIILVAIMVLAIILSSPHGGIDNATSVRA